MAAGVSRPSVAVKVCITGFVTLDFLAQVYRNKLKNVLIKFMFLFLTICALTFAL